MLEMGLEPPGNSDSAGTQPFATTPWHGVAAAVLRRTGGDEPVPPQREAISLAEAGLLPTRFAARATFADHAGSLEPGKLGDVAVFGRDPLETPAGELPAMEADLTVVGGRIVHRGAGAPDVP
jgi:hypothetical protein